MECCGRNWEMFEVDSGDMNIQTAQMAICRKCLSYEREETGQLDTEEAADILGVSVEEIEKEMV